MNHYVYALHHLLYLLIRKLFSPCFHQLFNNPVHPWCVYNVMISFFTSFFNLSGLCTHCTLSLDVSHGTHYMTSIKLHIDPCSSNPCRNGATCMTIRDVFDPLFEDGSAGYMCDCNLGWAGVNCEEECKTISLSGQLH